MEYEIVRQTKKRLYAEDGSVFRGNNIIKESEERQICPLQLVKVNGGG